MRNLGLIFRIVVLMDVHAMFTLRRLLCRRALCNLQALQPKLAVADFKRVLALEPRNDIARSQLDVTQKLIRRVEFEKAIEMEEEQNAADRCRQSILEGE